MKRQKLGREFMASHEVLRAMSVRRAGCMRSEKTAAAVTAISTSDSTHSATTCSSRAVRVVVAVVCVFAAE